MPPDGIGSNPANFISSITRALTPSSKDKNVGMDAAGLSAKEHMDIMGTKSYEVKGSASSSMIGRSNSAGSNSVSDGIQEGGSSSAASNEGQATTGTTKQEVNPGSVLLKDLDFDFDEILEDSYKTPLAQSDVSQSVKAGTADPKARSASAPAIPNSMKTSVTSPPPRAHSEGAKLSTEKQTQYDGEIKALLKERIDGQKEKIENLQKTHDEYADQAQVYDDHDPDEASYARSIANDIEIELNEEKAVLENLKQDFDAINSVDTNETQSQPEITETKTEDAPHHHCIRLPHRPPTPG